MELHPTESMIVRVRGISYFFEQHQRNTDLPSLILLHGFLGSGKIFESLIESLIPFCNPVTIDLLGHGNTEGAELHYRFSAREQVADLAKLIQEQLEVPAFLYGYSMGARLALQLAIHHQVLFSGLILESGTFGIEDETERQARQSLDASRSDQIMGNFSGFLEEWKTMPIFTSNKSIEKIQSRQNPAWMANSLQGFGTGTMPCLRKKLPQLITPTLLIVGEEDSKFIRINQTMRKEIPDSKLVIVKGSGHRVHTDSPQALAEQLNHFIEKRHTS
ncbi:MAG: 2-succinyl-6-hydroxy-2,4-cyclohexadiene-1-carboxylate synthase [Balneolales bacterium]|nr:2-succinyl-6-hydroxy-2,4-cyclohexadiene-1-carboxylate synthase [Balneolales bacterium]